MTGKKSTSVLELTANQRRVIDAALAIVFEQPPSLRFVRGHELRYSLRDLGKDVCDELIRSCIPRFLERQQYGLDNFFITFDGLLVASDQRPIRILSSMLELIAWRYNHEPDGRRQRAFLWSEIRHRGGFHQSDYGAAWFAFWTARVGDGGTVPPGANGTLGHPNYDYQFWIFERDLERMAEKATVEEWAELQRMRRLGEPIEQAEKDTEGMAIFHIKVDAIGVTSVMNDLTEDRLTREVVGPYQAGRKFFVDGKIVDRESITAIKIVRTLKTVAQFSAEYDEYNYQRGINDTRPFDRRQLPFRQGAAEDVTFAQLSAALAADLEKVSDSSEQMILRALKSFHDTTKPFRGRREGKPAIEFKDEYDVQDLLHAHLLVLTARVHPEEWCPSYAGRSARMDFLLTDLRSAVEAKRVRSYEHAKKISQELIEDIAHYANHPGVEMLYCLVYDPESLLMQPAALEEDLSKVHSAGENEVAVRVVVSPPRRS